tara:strand:- start:9 stop:752 length:744 start_codon:yes stop_codon:yes gene_type:complete
MAYKILIVEDDVAIRESLIDMLEINEYIVFSVENGLKGLELIEQQHLDLIISDVAMPEMDGFELLKKIRDNAKTELIPTIMLTAKVELESKLKGLEMGADDYITKPFEFRELHLKINNLIQKQEKLIHHFSLIPDKNLMPSQDIIFLKKLKFLLEENITESKLQIDFLAKHLCMSTSTLQRKVKKITGKPTVQIIKEFKLKKAQEMITANYGTLSEIAYKSGFNSLSYFSTSYKEFLRKTPTEELKK